jgi:glycosyltransferase involved in cell wall biosynthesis
MFDWRWVSESLKLMRRERVALIHAHEFTANTYGMLLAQLAGVPLIATVHGKSYYPDQVKRRLAYRMVSRRQTMVAVSHDLKQFLVEAVGIPEDKISVIHNGIDVTAHSLQDGPEDCRRELDLPSDEWVLGTVGSLYAVKGQAYLLRALPLVLHVHPHTTLLIVGRGEQEVSLKEEARHLGIESHVRFLGLRQDVPKLLSVMDAFVLPSLSEGLSIALLEAMAAGKPIVATRVGGNPEIVLDATTGYLVPAQAPQALADSIIRLLANRSLALEFGEKGRQRVLQHFSLSRMAEQYQALYEARLRQHSRTNRTRCCHAVS